MRRNRGGVLDNIPSSGTPSSKEEGSNETGHLPVHRSRPDSTIPCNTDALVGRLGYFYLSFSTSIERLLVPSQISVNFWDLLVYHWGIEWLVSPKMHAFIPTQPSARYGRGNGFIRAARRAVSNILAFWDFGCSVVSALNGVSACLCPAMARVLRPPDSRGTRRARAES